MPDSARQTLSFLIRRFREVGIRPRTKLGQNFLIDINLQELLVRAAEVDRRDVVLEVGTGTGAVTALLAARAAAVVTVELDPQMHQLASEELHGLDNVQMLLADVLAGKHRLQPEVLEAVAAHLAAEPQRRFKLVANLPYNAATPLLSNLLALDRPPASMTVTIQKELADRLAAPPGTSDYGALSVWVQSQCRVEIVRTMPPDVFWPRPKVSSAIVHIALDEALRGRIADRDSFHAFVRAMFLHRRKFLRSELATVVKDRLDKPGVDAVLASLGLAGQLRAEQLSPDDLLRLHDAVQCGRR